jgi:TatD DNase family protein
VRILSNARVSRGVVHCFTEGADEAEQYLELGLCIGITGYICDDRRAAPVREAVRNVPRERLMVETDAPFLIPRDMPRRQGRRNEPAYLPYVVAAVARYTGRPERDVRCDTTANAIRVFGLAQFPGDR